MILDALKTVLSAEEQADRQLAAAALEARKILAEAEAEGVQMLSTAEAEAEEELAAISLAAEQEAARIARDIANRADAACQALRSAAQRRMPTAVQFILDRIVVD